MFLNAFEIVNLGFQTLLFLTYKSSLHLYFDIYLKFKNHILLLMWKFFKKLLSSTRERKTEIVTKKEMSFDIFLQDDQVQQTISKLKRETVLLNPRRDTSNRDVKSKMGGEPNLMHFESYPVCDSCNSPLNFVLQLFKQEFPEFYWPDNKTIFQLYRCPNYDCSGAFSENYDLKMFHFYFTSFDDTEKFFSKPVVEIPNRESEVAACLFHRETVADYPMFESGTYEEHEELELHFSDELIVEFEERYQPKQQTKIMGYPSFTQNTYYPICNCGKEKEFFFQLASEDNDGDVNSKDFTGNHAWSHHGIMIGDVGNIYYFVCADCGEKSIESYWDCS